ncbi:MAG: hypothetical protein QOI29_2187 [Mycobacterium sp.]|nr:hypothetical protein [Mycobacterium sp.]
MPDLTFLMNADPAGSSNQFYTLAKKYFVAAASTVIDAPAKGQTLEGVFSKLKSLNVLQGTINLVSHASGFASMECPVTLASQTAGRATMTADDLQDALAAKSLAPPGPGVITDKTRIVIYGCDVGRSSRFLTMLSGLFGDPGEVLAPRRLSLFMLAGSTVQYRQAQTWSLVRKAPLLPAGASVPAGGWPAYRAAFVKDASNQFARAALATGDIVGVEGLTTMLTTAASKATTAMAPTFFFEEGIDIFPTGSQTAAQAAASVKPISNGDPVVAAAQSVSQVDDTTQVTTVSGTDAYPANAAKTAFAISVVILAQVIDQDVAIAEGTGYRRVTTSKGLAPSPGPKSTGGSAGGGAGGAGASNDALQSVIDQLLADGVAQADIDALLAAVPKGDATEGLAAYAPDETPVTGDPDDPTPARQERA